MALGLNHIHYPPKVMALGLSHIHYPPKVMALGLNHIHYPPKVMALGLNHIHYPPKVMAFGLSHIHYPLKFPIVTRLLGRPQPQMYPPVSLNQYTLVNQDHKYFIYMLQGPTTIIK